MFSKSRISKWIFSSNDSILLTMTLQSLNEKAVEIEITVISIFQFKFQTSTYRSVQQFSEPWFSHTFRQIYILFTQCTVCIYAQGTATFIILLEHWSSKYINSQFNHIFILHQVHVGGGVAWIRSNCANIGKRKDERNTRTDVVIFWNRQISEFCYYTFPSQLSSSHFYWHYQKIVEISIQQNNNEKWCGLDIIACRCRRRAFIFCFV